MKKKRILIVILAVLLLMSLIAGCSNEKDPSGGNSKASTNGSESQHYESGAEESDTEASSEDEDGDPSAASGRSDSAGKTAGSGGTTSKKSSVAKPDISKINLKGAEISFRLGSLEGLSNSAGMIDETNPLVIPIRKAERQFNCKIKLQAFPNPTTIAADCITATNAGQIPYDIACINIHHVMPQMLAGIMADLKKLDYIDLSSKNFIPAFTDMHTYNNKTYGVFFGYSNGNYGVFYNKNKIKTTDPYQLYKQGKWDFAAFEALAKDTTKIGTSGRVENYGVACNMYLNGHAIVANAGGTVTRKNGKYTYSMIEQPGIDASTWVKSLLDKGYWYLSPDDSGAAGINLFCQGKATMLPWFVSFLTVYGDAVDFDIGFVPFPKGPNMSKHNVGIYDGDVYAIHTNSKTKNENSAILQVLSESHSALVERFISKTKVYGFDANSQQAARDLLSLTTPEFCMGVPTQLGGGLLAGNVIEDAIRNPNKSVATEVSKIKQAMLTNMNDFFSKNLK